MKKEDIKMNKKVIIGIISAAITLIEAAITIIQASDENNNK